MSSRQTVGWQYLGLRSSRSNYLLLGDCLRRSSALLVASTSKRIGREAQSGGCLCVCVRLFPKVYNVNSCPLFALRAVSRVYKHVGHTSIKRQPRPICKRAEEVALCEQLVSDLSWAVWCQRNLRCVQRWSSCVGILKLSQGPSWNAQTLFKL